MRFSDDTGNDPFEMARKFGFRSFNSFLTSDEMKEYVTITKGVCEEPSYHAAERDTFNHIRKEQVESFQNNCMRRARREGFCDTKRMRPKLLEVAKICQWNAAFYDKNLEAAKQPDVLTRPGPGAASIRRNKSMWRETQDRECSDEEDWTDKLTKNVKAVISNPRTTCEIDWGYEELGEETSCLNVSKDVRRKSVNFDDSLNRDSQSSKTTPMFHISSQSTKTISWRDDDESVDFRNELKESKNIPRGRTSSYD